MSFTPEEIAIIEKAFDDAIAKSPILQMHLEGALRDIRGKTEQEPFKMICPRCKVDRVTTPCPNRGKPGDCPMTATAQNDACVEQSEQDPLMITPGGGAFPFVEVGDTNQVGFLIDGIVHLDDDYKTGVWPLYTTPVRTKDLTDKEIEEAVLSVNLVMEGWITYRAVIDADRKKNK